MSRLHLGEGPVEGGDPFGVLVVFLGADLAPSGAHEEHGQISCRRWSIVALMGMHTLKVSEHDLAVERMAMRNHGMLHHGVSDYVYFVASEVEAAARAQLRIGHRHIQSLRALSPPPRRRWGRDTTPCV